MDIREKLKEAIASICEDADVELIGFCEEAEHDVVPSGFPYQLTRMPTGEYSFIINFTRLSQVEAFLKRRHGV